MYAIVSRFNPNTERRAKEIWTMLENSCGLVGIKLFSLPHFSWQGADSYDLDAVELILEKIAKEMPQFSVTTAGLGVFSGDRPVLYLPIVKTRHLLEVHEFIWSSLVPYSKSPNLYYAPDVWMPHITLAMEDVTPYNLACAIEELSENPFNLIVTVDSISIAYAEGNNVGIHREFKMIANRR
jgi:2'-5' RNA ligase